MVLGPQRVDPALLELEIFELRRGPDLVFGQLRQFGGRQVAAAGVAEEHVGAALSCASQPRQDAPCQVGVVAAVAGKDNIDVRRLIVEYVAMNYRHPAAIGARVQLNCHGGEDVDVGAGRLGSPRLKRGQSTQAGPRGKVENAPAGHDLGMLAEVPAYGQTAGPREGPVGKGRVGIVRLELDGTPERQHFVREVESDFRETRHRTEAGVPQDEGAGRVGHGPTVGGRRPLRRPAVATSRTLTLPGRGRIVRPTVGLLLVIPVARTLDPSAHAIRRDAFLDAALRLIQVKGYEQMSVQDVLDDLDVSKGAFYHYFGSKEALLAAVVDRMIKAAMAGIGPIVADPDPTALARLGRLFSAIAQWKGERTELMIELVRVWFSDSNAVVRDQLRRGTQETLTPLLAQIVRQGKDEGAFTINSPEHTARVLVSILLGLNETASQLFLARQAGAVTFEDVECTLAAYAEACERVLGLQPGSWPSLDRSTLLFWFG